MNAQGTPSEQALGQRTTDAEGTRDAGNPERDLTQVSVRGATSLGLVGVALKLRGGVRGVRSVHGGGV